MSTDDTTPTPRFPEVKSRLSNLSMPVVMLAQASADMRRAGVPEEDRQEFNELPLLRDPDEMRAAIAEWVTVQ